MYRGRIYTSCLLIGALVTGCGQSRFDRNRRPPKATFALGTCDGGDPRTTLGTFDMQLQPTSDPKTFAFLIFPIEVNRPGETINIIVAATGTASYKELVQRAYLRPNTTIFAGYLTREELESYNAVVISQYVPGVPPIEAKPQYSNICALLLPGQGVKQ